MVITRILGGLGNQMFQYAAGLSLAVKLESELKMDVREFKDYSLHQGFELERIFSVQGTRASSNDLNRVLGWQSSRLAKSFIQKMNLSFLNSEKNVKEPSFEYWKGFEILDGDLYLDGYWQSEEYFKNIEDNIRLNFEFKIPFDKKNQKLSEVIQSVDSISLHIRRGDYLNSNSANLIHGTCSMDYYHNAINYLKRKLDAPVLFVFSDDIAWVKKNLGTDLKAYYVSHNIAKNSYRDMQLMSLCNHNIIANSTFSWWGAWLNKNRDKIVIAPQKWFANDEMQLKTVNIYPNSWVKL
jgi:hypothetical protein